MVAAASPLHAAFMDALTAPCLGEYTRDGRARWNIIARRLGISMDVILRLRADLRDALVNDLSIEDIAARWRDGEDLH